MNVQNERQEAGPIDLVAGETACIDATDGLNAIPAVLDTPSLEATKSPAPEEALPEKVVTDEVVSEPFSVSTKIETSESTDPRVVELRALLPAELSALLTDGDCSRFLRARSYNITKAVDMLLKWGKWWETPLPGMDVLPKDICSKPDEQEDVYTRMLPHANLGENINGCPIYWEKTGQSESVY